MSFQEKNITVSLVSFVLIWIYYSIRLVAMINGNSFNLDNLTWLWVTIIIWAIIITILGTILTHIISAIIEAIMTRKEPLVKDISDERDKLIDLKGTRNTHVVFSLGVFAAMLTFVFGQPGLVMFSLLVFFGLMAQVIGDISRLYFYRRGL